MPIVIISLVVIILSITAVIPVVIPFISLSFYRNIHLSWLTIHYHRWRLTGIPCSGVSAGVRIALRIGISRSWVWIGWSRIWIPWGSWPGRTAGGSDDHETEQRYW